MTREVELDLTRFHAGDEALFERLVRTHSPRLLSQLRRYAGDDADVHDLLQDVWLRAYRKRQTYEGRGSLVGWLLMIGRTVGMAAVGRRRREQAGGAYVDAVTDSTAEAMLLQDTVLDAVLTLPERQRDVVLLRVIEGRSTAETAQLLHCAEGTVKATLHQAVHKLRNKLNGMVS